MNPTYSPTAEAAGTERPAADLSTLFKRPLIAGASVSADCSTLSPGKRLAYEYTDRSSIRTIAMGGRPGLEMAAKLTENILKEHSILIAVDLFFWDSTLTYPEPSLKALNDLMARAKKLDLPVVIGDIPGLLPHMQPQRQRLNRAIRDACASYSRCGIMPFDSIHEEVMWRGGLRIGDRSLALRELVPDGLHLSETASMYLMERLREVIPQ